MAHTLHPQPKRRHQELCIKALEEQRRQLKEHEGSNRKVEKRIEKELKWVSKLSASSADKEAKRAGFETEEAEEDKKPAAASAAAAASS